jgi:hypothetical protein
MVHALFTSKLNSDKWSDVPDGVIFSRAGAVMPSKRKKFLPPEYARNFIIVRAKVNLSLFIVRLLIQVGFGRA